jgi:hypothetical protein
MEMLFKKDTSWDHTWMPQLAMNGNWMDAIPSLIRCCVGGLQTMVTCGYLWLNGKILLEDGLDLDSHPVHHSLHFFCLLGKGKGSRVVVHRATITLHKSSLTLCTWVAQTNSKSSLLPHHPTSPSKITSMKDFNLLFFVALLGLGPPITLKCLVWIIRVYVGINYQLKAYFHY